MPFRKGLAFGTQPVRATLGQPVERPDGLPVENDAVDHAGLSPGIIGASTVATVEQSASDIGRIDQPRLLVFQLVQAAAPAAVAQSFPLSAVELGQRLVPERLRGICCIGHDKFRDALLSARLQGAGDEKVG